MYLWTDLPIPLALYAHNSDNVYCGSASLFTTMKVCAACSLIKWGTILEALAFGHIHVCITALYNISEFYKDAPCKFSGSVEIPMVCTSGPRHCSSKLNSWDVSVIVLSLVESSLPLTKLILWIQSLMNVDLGHLLHWTTVCINKWIYLAEILMLSFGNHETFRFGQT